MRTEDGYGCNGRRRTRPGSITSKWPTMVSPCFKMAASAVSASAAFEKAIRFKQYDAGDLEALPNDQFAVITVFRYENTVLRSCRREHVFIPCLRSGLTN